MLARKSERTSSKGSYESESGETSRSKVPGGSGGRMYDGPRVRVRRGRREMLPNLFFVGLLFFGWRGKGGGGAMVTDNADVGILEKDGVVGLCLIVSEVFEDCCLRERRERHTGIFGNISIAVESTEDFRCT